MANRLELPDDLLQLVEKREGKDRRASGEESPGEDGAAPQPATELERRSGTDRRREE